MSGAPSDNNVPVYDINTNKIPSGAISNAPIEQAQITPDALKGGFKADAGKARLDLVPPMILAELIDEAIEASAHGETAKEHLQQIASGACIFWSNTDKNQLRRAITHANNLLAFDEGVTQADAILQLGELYEIGAKKYAARNWEKGMDWGRCFSAMTRHLLKFVKGEKYDEVDGQHHMTSVVWCAVALLHFAGNPDVYGEFDTRKAIIVAEDSGQK